MKKLLISLNILTLTVVYFNSCGVTSTTSSNSLLHNGTKSISVNYSTKPFIGIDVKLANAMVDNFKGSLNDSSDTRSVWFNLDTLKRFIWHIEQESKLKGFGSPELAKLGLRIYYGIYPAQSTWSSTYPNMVGVNTAFENKHTVFMIPTYFDGSFNKEFDPTQFSLRRPVPFGKTLNDRNAKLFALGAVNPDVDLQNHGDLIPPMNSNYRGADFMEFADTN